MAKKRYSPEQIIQCLREVEIHTFEGKTIATSIILEGPNKHIIARGKNMVDSSQARRSVLRHRERKKLKNDLKMVID